MKKAFMFAGQGCQYIGMGSELFIEFYDLINQANEILGYDIKRLCVDETRMHDTLYTQPLVFCINAFYYLKTIQTNRLPHYLIGHSLGEYNAIFASGALSFTDALKLVQQRAELMAKANGGAMVALIGIDINKIKEILNKFPNVVISNYNTPFQTVISGNLADIKYAVEIFEKVCRCVFLRVSGAFHSYLMNEAKKEMEKYIRNISFTKMQIPVISNVSSVELSDDNIKEKMIEQIVSPVKFVDSVNYLIKNGVDDFLEIGNKKILVNMISEIRGKNA